MFHLSMLLLSFLSHSSSATIATNNPFNVDHFDLLSLKNLHRPKSSFRGIASSRASFPSNDPNRVIDELSSLKNPLNPTSFDTAAATAATTSTTNNVFNPELFKSLKNQFERYDINHNKQLDVDEFLSLIRGVKGLKSLHIHNPTPCGRHLLSTCKTIEKLYNRQTKAVMLHKMCTPCVDNLQPFPIITGHPHLPTNWQSKPLSTLVNRDVVKRTGKSRLTGNWLTGTEYLKSLTFNRGRL